MKQRKHKLLGRIYPVTVLVVIGIINKHLSVIFSEILLKPKAEGG